MDGAGDFTGGGLTNPLEENMQCASFSVLGATNVQSDVITGTAINGTSITATGALTGATIEGTTEVSVPTVKCDTLSSSSSDIQVLRDLKMNDQNLEDVDTIAVKTVAVYPGWTEVDLAGDLKMVNHDINCKSVSASTSVDCKQVECKFLHASTSVDFKKNALLYPTTDPNYLTLQATNEGGLKLGNNTGEWVDVMPIWQDQWGADETSSNSVSRFRNGWSNVIQGNQEITPIDTPYLTRQYSKLAGTIFKVNWLQGGTDSRVSASIVHVIDANDVTLGNFTIPIGSDHGTISTSIYVPANELYGVRFSAFGDSAIDKLIVSLVFHSYAAPAPPAPFIPPPPPLLRSTHPSQKPKRKLEELEEQEEQKEQEEQEEPLKKKKKSI